MRELFWRAVADAGLAQIARARLAGDLSRARGSVELFETCDLLALGALADEVRRREVGDRVSVHARPAGDASPRSPSGTTDLEQLRAFAIERLTSEPGSVVVVDWTVTGLELAQIALGFGANALIGALSRKAGLPVLDGETVRVKGEGQVEIAELKRRELASVLAAVGREAVFIEPAEPSRPVIKKGPADARLDP